MNFSHKNTQLLLSITIAIIGVTVYLFIYGLKNKPSSYAQTLPSPSGSVLKIYAAGIAFNQTYPHMQIYIDDTAVADFTVDGIVKAYDYVHVNTITPNQIKIEFTNDQADRALRVDAIELDGVVYQTETHTKTNSGFWDGSQCTTAKKQTEWLDCNGAIQFQ